MTNFYLSNSNFTVFNSKFSKQTDFFQCFSANSAAQLLLYRPESKIITQKEIILTGVDTLTIVYVQIDECGGAYPL